MKKGAGSLVQGVFKGIYIAAEYSFEAAFTKCASFNCPLNK